MEADLDSMEMCKINPFRNVYNINIKLFIGFICLVRDRREEYFAGTNLDEFDVASYFSILTPSTVSQQFN